jgi:2,4-dienoyl-CoA reductase-like NADH-dependent reductase (Old Yellow Enzyme family)
VARQIDVVRQVRQHLDQTRNSKPETRNPILIGTAYSYLQEYLPHVAQYTVRNGWTDMVGLGRMVLSYPEVLSDATTKGMLTPKLICRTFSDCTTAPRNGLISGCYPLDKFYSAKSEFAQLKEIKKTAGA